MAGNLGFPSSAGSPWAYTTLAPESVNNPNNVSGQGAYPYTSGMDYGMGSPGFTSPAPNWGMGSAGFPAPATAGPSYQYGTGMGFGLPDISQPDPRIAQEAERNRLEAERNQQEAQRRQGSMNFGLPDIYDNRRQEEEQRRWAEENRRSIEEGGEGLPPYLAPTYTVDSGILQGGYDPGDMGDAATTQGHTDYMRAAQAMYERTQAEARQREAAAEQERQQFYAYQQFVQQQQQQQFNQNVAGLNPTNIYDRWSSGQSTQYQPY